MMMCVSVLCWLLRIIRAQVDVAATLTDGGGATTITLDVVDGSTSYLTQADFETTVNEAWLIIMATFVFRTFLPPLPPASSSFLFSHSSPRLAA